MIRCCALVVSLSAAAAWAQCRADADCKGDRICVSGECRAPRAADEPGGVPLPAPAEPGRVSTVRELPGWALGGAVFGFVSSGMVLALAAGSAIENGNWVPSVSLGAAATVTFGVSVPLVASASSSVRESAGVNGVVGLRVAGWVGYGLTLANAVVAIALGVLDYSVPTPLIVTLGVLGAADEVLFSVEALVARSQANAVVERNLGAGRPPALRVAPIFALVPDRVSGGTTGLVGVAGAF